MPLDDTPPDFAPPANPITPRDAALSVLVMTERAVELGRKLERMVNLMASNCARMLEALETAERYRKRGMKVREREVYAALREALAGADEASHVEPSDWPDTAELRRLIEEMVP